MPSYSFAVLQTLQRVRKRSSTLTRPRIRRTPKAEDNSKIKDRLEALLYAETLQETLFPNANPERG
jgi:hypothetical protein